MKRNNILIWISVLFLALVFSACYDDESTYDTNIIPEVVIDTTGIPARHSVFFNHTMTLEPKIYKRRSGCRIGIPLADRCQFERYDKNGIGT